MTQIAQMSTSPYLRHLRNLRIEPLPKTSGDVIFRPLVLRVDEHTGAHARGAGVAAGATGAAASTTGAALLSIAGCTTCAVQAVSINSTAESVIM